MVIRRSKALAAVSRDTRRAKDIKATEYLAAVQAHQESRKRVHISQERCLNI